MVFVNEKENKRVIDYERNVYLEPANNPMGLTVKRRNALSFRSWNLCLDGQKVYFTTHLTTDMDPDNPKQGDLTYTIIMATLPEELKHKKCEIKELIAEAMDVFGLEYGKKMSSISI